MKLNQDCIRDILLYVEANTETADTEIDFEVLCSALPYSKEVLDYHVKTLYDGDLFIDIQCAEDEIESISRLSFNGHCFVDNIRDDKVWSTLKKGVSTLASVSLPILVKQASDIITNLLAK